MILFLYRLRMLYSREWYNSKMEQFFLDNIFWMAAAVVSTAGLTWTFVRSGRINLSPQSATLAVSRGGGVFLDIRPAVEFAAGHIPRSQNIPASELSTRLASIAKFKQKPVVMVCPNGAHARRAARQLTNDGFAQVHVLSGGIAGWRDANLPLFNKRKSAK